MSLRLPLLLTVLFVPACSDLGPVRSDLERNRELWEEFRPSSYAYAVERICFCGMPGPARVTVEGDDVVSVVLVESGEPVPEPSSQPFPSVGGLFDILEEAVEREAHSIDVTYDPDTGVPTEFFIDYEEHVVDEELGMRVTEPVAELVASP